MARWIGVDYGTKRIGLALGDDLLRIASPGKALPGTGDPAVDAQHVARFASEQEAFGVVVGVPFNMDGSEGPQARLTRRFLAALRERIEPDRVQEWDERLSSFAADEHMREGGWSRSRRKGRRDALAAQVILQAFFDAGSAGETAPSDER